MKRRYVFVSIIVVALIAGVTNALQGKPQLARVSESGVAESDGGTGPLDGMTFMTKLGPVGKPFDVEDNLVFADGKLTSEECDRRCGYPPAAYFVRNLGDRIEFVSESNCLYKDATLSWRGTVENGVIKGHIKWVARRWYWTVENDLRFEGRLVPKAVSGALAN